MLDKIDISKKCDFRYQVTLENYRHRSLVGCENDKCDCPERADCYLRRLLTELQRREQECEKLKKQLNRTLYLSEGALRLYAERQIIKYKNAFDEIEINISEYQNLTLGKPRTMRENDCLYNILDIINKTRKY